MDGHQAQPTTGAQHVHRGAHPVRGTGHFEGDGRARVLGPGIDPSAHVVARRIEGGQAETLGRLSAEGVRLHQDDVGAFAAGHHGDQHADRAAADNDNLLTGAHIGTAHVVHGHRGRFDERGVVEGEPVGQSDQGVDRDHPGLLHGAGGVDADEVEPVADMVVAGSAGRALAAPAQSAAR